MNTFRYVLAWSTVIVSGSGAVGTVMYYTGLAVQHGDVSSSKAAWSVVAVAGSLVVAAILPLAVYMNRNRS